MHKLRIVLSATGTALAAALLLAGCQSPWVQATVTNDQDTPINLVEVNYPGGSFGIQNIAPHATFHYRFHILLNDKVEVDFTDATRHNHTVKGPQLDQGEAGTLGIAIEPNNTVLWTPALAHQK
jgi:hypothetical protein